MNTLRLGTKNQFVERWQIFLRGLNEDSNVVVSGTYDDTTFQETINFQTAHGLDADGIVGPKTIAAALKVGFDLIEDDSSEKEGPNWPPRPKVNPPLFRERIKLFGQFAYNHTPVSRNPEAITINGDWVKNNIVSIEIPQLSGVPGSNRNGVVQVHRSTSKQFIKLFADWQSAGLSEKILTWGGSWVPRFVRGSRTSLSNHAWGTAFDINAQWNGLGVRPALRNEEGSVRDLVDIAYQNGFYWGGWFKSRPDGMHFEVYKIIE